MASQTSSKDNPNDFLGLLQTWKTEMMQAMDTKIEMAVEASANPPGVSLPQTVYACSFKIPRDRGFILHYRTGKLGPVFYAFRGIF